jgi:hypothetical protein
MPPTPDIEVAEAGRQVALYVTELEARRPLTVGEDYLVRKQRADDENTREILKWNDVLSQQLTQSLDSGDELTVHVQKLLSRWKNFESECLSEKHRKEFANDSPDIQSVSKVIQSLTIHYQTSHDQTTTSTNKVVRSLRRMGQGMNAHKTMLQIVPSGNNYAAIICGVVQTIIRVGAVDSPLAPADLQRLPQHIIESQTQLLGKLQRSTTTLQAASHYWIFTQMSVCIDLLWNFTAMFSISLSG